MRSISIFLRVLVPALLLQGAVAELQQSPNHLKVTSYPQEMRTAYSVEEGLPSDDVRALALALAPSGELYAGTSAGLGLFADGHWTALADAPKDINQLCFSDSTLFLIAGTTVYQLRDGAFTLFASGLPSPPTALVVNKPAPNVVLLAATKDGLFTIQSGEVTPLPVFDDTLMEIQEITDVVVSATGEITVATPKGLRHLASGETGSMEWRTLLPAKANVGWNMVQAQALGLTPDGGLIAGAPQGLAREAADNEWELYTGHDGLPYNDFTCIAQGDRLWLGTRKGLIHYDGTHWAYRAGKRWLPDNDVRDIVLSDDGAWVATAGGVSHIYFKAMTFAEKAAFYESEIDQYHRRTPYGYVAGVSLAQPNDKSVWEQHDTDNDGQYTGLYGAAECLAYGATGDPAAKDRATRAFEALAFLSEVTQSGAHPAPPGFIARTIRPTSGPNPNDHDTAERDRNKQQGDALWKVMDPRWPTSGDENWFWKTDASSDELDGHFLLYGLYYDHVAESDAEKARAREVTARVMDHLIAHNFRLVDYDGEPTRWANFSPESLNGDPDWWAERGLNSLSLLTYLNVTWHVTGEQKYRDVFMDLVENHQYALNGMVAPKLQAGPGSYVQFDDKMSFMNYYSLLRYEKDPQVLRMFQNSIFYYWQIVRQERNPFFNFVYAALCEGKGMKTQWGVTDLSPTHEWLADSVDTLKRFPMDLVMWPMTNSHRIDLIPLGTHVREPGKADGTGYRVDGYVIPIDERNALSFSEDTWRYDDGSGNGMWLDEGSPFLLGYYLGLYHGFIVE